MIHVLWLVFLAARWFYRQVLGNVLAQVLVWSAVAGIAYKTGAHKAVKGLHARFDRLEGSLSVALGVDVEHVEDPA